MDFLAGLKVALSQGISKEEYISFWNTEMEQKTANSVTESNISPDSKHENVHSDESFTETDQILSLLKKISKQQDSFQQQLQDLQVSYDKHERLMLKWVEQRQNNFSQEIFALETSLSNLQESLTGIVRTCVHSECLNFQEKISLMIKTLYNHTLDEARNVAAGDDGGFRNTLSGTKIRGDKISRPKSQDLEDSDEDKNMNTSDEVWYTAIDDQGRNNFDSEIFGDVPQPMTDVKLDKLKNDFSITGTETTNKFKQILHSELSSILVNVQKLLLKPINSKDISCYTTEEVKKLLLVERNITNDQLFKIQSAISSDVQAQLSKMEISFNQELQKVNANLTQHNRIYSKLCTIHNDFQYLQNYISTKLPGIIASNIKLVQGNENENYTVLEERELHESGNQYYDGQRPIKSRQSEREMQEKSYPEPNGKEDGHTKSQTALDSTLETLSIEQAQGAQASSATNLLTDANSQYNVDRFWYQINCNDLAVEQDVTISLPDIDPGYNLLLKVKKANKSEHLQFRLLAVHGPQDESLNWPADFNIKIELNDKYSQVRSKTENSFTKKKTVSKPREFPYQSTSTPVCYFKNKVYNLYVHNDLLYFTVSVSLLSGTQQDVTNEF